MAIFTILSRNAGQRIVRDQNDSGVKEPKTGSGVMSPAVQEGDVASIPPGPDAAQLMSTTPSLSQLAASGLLDAKDRRAYEVERQRRKKPGDRRKTRGQNTSTGHNCWYCAGRPRAVVRPGAVAMREGGGDVAVVEEPEEVIKEEEKPSIGKVDQIDAREVLLEDLIRTAKVRKEKAGDFELIPKMPPVLVLDDLESKDVPEIEEPWEHIYSSANSSQEEINVDVKPPSYAQVVKN